MVNVTDCAKKRLCCYVTDAKKTITYAWFASLLLVFIAFIVACVSASQMAKANGGAGKAAGFAAVWTVLLLILLSAMGTYIMRRLQTALAIGFFLGIIFIMTQQMLILFAFFVERSKQPNQAPSVVSSQQAMAVFAFFLFLVYAAFGSMLAIFRNDVIKPNEAPSSDTTHYETDEATHDEQDHNVI